MGGRLPPMTTIKKKKWKVVFQCVVCLKTYSNFKKNWLGHTLNLPPKFKLKANTISNFVCAKCGERLDKVVKTQKVRNGKFANRLFELGIVKRVKEK
jgi:uncharacterized protein YlaI